MRIVHLCTVIVLIMVAHVPLAHALSIAPAKVHSVHDGWTVRCVGERIDWAKCFIETNAVFPEHYRAEVGLGVIRVDGELRLFVSLSGSVGSLRGAKSGLTRGRLNCLVRWNVSRGTIVPPACR